MWLWYFNKNVKYLFIFFYPGQHEPEQRIWKANSMFTSYPRIFVSFLQRSDHWSPLTGDCGSRDPARLFSWASFWWAHRQSAHGHIPGIPCLPKVSQLLLWECVVHSSSHCHYFLIFIISFAFNLFSGYVWYMHWSHQLKARGVVWRRHLFSLLAAIEVCMLWWGWLPDMEYQSLLQWI